MLIDFSSKLPENQDSMEDITELVPDGEASHDDTQISELVPDGEVNHDDTKISDIDDEHILNGEDSEFGKKDITEEDGEEKHKVEKDPEDPQQQSFLSFLNLQKGMCIHCVPGLHCRKKNLTSLYKSVIIVRSYSFHDVDIAFNWLPPMFEGITKLGRNCDKPR